MACIEKMTIQGIRSFGTTEQDKGLIMFFAPLTLILGQNGTGKTTIIECLKYITTGEMPPGGKQGAAFIHDPKVAGDTEVKAQIRLLFRDITGQKCMVIRSLVATQMRSKVNLKTLDSTLTRVLPSGEKQSISSRCTEMDREMVSLLGVSKAVLDNVIFCHQEESNWPLSEGKTLKQKFDDIFASTRYVKALETIRKLRLEQGNDIREYQAEIKYLKQNKDKAAEIAKDLADREIKREAATDTVKKAEEKLQPVRKKLDQVMTRESDVFKIKTTIEKYKSERDQLEKAQRDLRSNMKSLFEGSTTELKSEIAEFEDKVVRMERSLKQNQDKLSALVRDLEKQDHERSKLLTDSGRLVEEAERQDRNIKGRDQLVRKFAKDYNFPGFSSDITDELAKELLSRLECRVRELLDQAKALRVENEKKEEILQKEIDKHRSNKTKFETERKMKQDRLVSNRDEIRKINLELSRVDASAGRLTDVDRDVRNVELELEETERSVDIDSLKSELQQLQKDKSTMDNKLKLLDAELTRLTQELSARTQLDLHLKDKTSKEEQIRRLKSKNEDTLQHILGAVPNENIGKALDKYLRDHSRLLRTNTDQLQTMHKRIVELQTTHKMQQESLSKKQEELRGYEAQIMNATKGVDFDVALTNIQSKLQTSQDSKGNVTAIEFMFKKYINKLRTHDPTCPLCHRPFDEQSEVDELISEMDTKLNLVPEKLERLSTAIDESKADYERLLQLKPICSVVNSLKTKDIPALETVLQSLNSEIQKLSTDITEKEELVDADKNDESMAKSMLSDATQIDRLQAEILDVNRKIEAQKSKLSSGNTSRTLHDVQNEKGEVQLEIDMTSQKLERKRQKLNEHVERIQRLKSSLNDLRTEKLQIETDLQRRTRLEDSKEELTLVNESLDHEIQEATEQIRPLQDKIDEMLEEKERMIRSKEQQFEEGKEQCTKVREHLQQVERFQSDINRYIREGRAEKLKDCHAKMDELGAARTKLELSKNSLSDEINQTRQDLAAQKIHQRELVDNLQLRDRQKEIEAMGEKIKVEEERLGGLDVDNLAKERRTLENDYQKFTDEKDLAKSRQQVLEGEIAAFQRDLKSDMYKDADVKYRDKMITLKTTEMANKDLEKYYKALDGTILQYHKNKMSDINKIIRELWRNTYRGNDIETIEIKSEDEEGSGAAKSRRSYNYRVVMIKGSTELDMRGRCSAGQKVLASLIIRLALAETFCLNCGVLALDEPTTNLDRENIESLAAALVEIIKSRQRQRNFQLIVITHDEDFVDLLGRSDYVDEFFRVSKNDFGCSRLTKMSVQELHTK